MGGLIVNPFTLLWSFYGRIGRLAYLGGFFLVIALVVAGIFGIVYLIEALGYVMQGQPKTLTREGELLVGYSIIVGGVLLLWAKLALAAKRFHDLGNTGWLCLLLFIPLVGLIAFIYLLFARGNDHDNKIVSQFE
jgi:uncharacterized membrane protein YhaH (DUF805 family)